MTILTVLAFRDLPLTIEMYDPSTIVEFPEFDGHRFRDILDQEMGFI